MPMLLALLLLVVAVPAQAGPQRNHNLLGNPGFETLAGEQPAGWQPYGKGHDLATTGHGGRRAVHCQAADNDTILGIQQDVVFDPPIRHPFKLSGWSKARGAGGGGDYCIYLDCFYDDGTPLWGVKAHFSTGTHDWEYTETTFTPDKPIRKIQYFVLFRRCQGEVWFDDFSLSLAPFAVQAEQLLPSVYGGNSLDYSARLSLPARWEATVARGAEVVHRQQGQGTGVAVAWDGRDTQGTLLPGGSYTLRVAATDDLLGETMVVEKQATTRSGPGQGYVAWTDSSMERTLIGRLPRPDRTLQATLSLARNEYESCQIALRTAPRQELRDCRVNLSDLKGPGGAMLARTHLQWQLVGFVEMTALAP